MNTGSTLKRWLLVGAGLVSLALAILGVVLPGLPTTPFVLLAATCFAKASPSLHSWLIHHRWFGPLVRDWTTHRSLPLRIKWMSSGLMWVMVAFSAWQLRQNGWAIAAIVAMGFVGTSVVWRIPTRTIPGNKTHLQPQHPIGDKPPAA